MVNRLGFNDIGWGFSSAEAVLDHTHDIVRKARHAKSDVGLAIANIPHRRYMPGREDLIESTSKYNGMLLSALASWSTRNSPIQLVDVAGTYGCAPEGCPSGYDGLHPNALGEYQIAAAFSITLERRFGLTHLEVPSIDEIPRRPKPVPNDVKASGAAMGVTVRWCPVFGARSYEIQHRIQGAPGWDSSVVQSNRYDTTFTVAGIPWEYRVRTVVGDSEEDKSEWSGIVKAVSRKDTPPPPSDISACAEHTGVRVTWAELDSKLWVVDRYAVTLLDEDKPGAMMICYGYKGNQARFSGLTSGHKYAVFVGTWAWVGGEVVGGLPAGVGTVVPT